MTECMCTTGSGCMIECIVRQGVYDRVYVNDREFVASSFSNLTDRVITSYIAALILFSVEMYPSGKKFKSISIHLFKFYINIFQLKLYSTNCNNRTLYHFWDNYSTVFFLL